ncbi:unnamed protein product [Dicrocoelium dendriticum]|nr:unnamed protein product [Dicrocoelium dendriticum]
MELYSPNIANFYFQLSNSSWALFLEENDTVAYLGLISRQTIPIPNLLQISTSVIMPISYDLLLPVSNSEGRGDTSRSAQFAPHFVREIELPCNGNGHSNENACGPG